VAAVTVRSGIWEMARCQCDSPAPSRYTGGRGRSLARPAEVTTSDPPPSVTRQQSSTDSGLETIRLASTPSTVSGSRTNALGLSIAHRRAATATSASWVRVVPYWCMWRAAASA
jgi:hypothetical protein